jgi:hypothetical protein
MAFFDKDAFLNQEVDELDVKSIPLDEGDRDDCFLHEAEPIIGMDKNNKPWMRLNIGVKVPLTSEESEERGGREYVILRLDNAIFVQCEWDEEGNPIKILDGKQQNIALGKLRNALDQNYKGWNLGQLKGAGPVTARVIQKIDSRNSEGTIFNAVSQLLKS